MTAERIIEKTRTKLPEVDSRYHHFTGRSIKVAFFDDGITLPKDASEQFKLLRFARWELGENKEWVYKGICQS